MITVKAIGAYYQIVDITKTPVSIPQNISDNPAKNLDKITDSHVPDLALHFPPVAYSSDGKNFELIAKLWCYKIQIQRQANQILFLVFPDKAEADRYRDKILPKQSASTEAFIASLVQSTSKATVYRHKAINSRRACPFCGDALMKPPGKWQADEEGFFKAHCYNSKQGRCDCCLHLTAPEKVKFENYEFITMEHVRKISGKTCPKCGSDLYLRILHLVDGTILYYEICRNYRMSSKTECTYKKKLPGEPK